MDILKIVAELHAERQQVEEAIVVFERLAVATRGKRRGRPPKWLSEANAEVDKASSPRKKRPFSPAARKRMAAAQKKRGATKKARQRLRVLQPPNIAHQS
jgi:hypothetical protein